MRRKIVVMSVFLILVVCLSACGDSWIKPKITSSIDEYSLATSTVPGLPIRVGVTVDGPPTNITSIKLITNKGSFLEMNNDNEVINVGKVVELAGKKIYWTPRGENNEITERAKITAIVAYFDKIVEVGKTTSRRIYVDKDGMYTFR